jgi:2-oxoglutarate ferredoxin oxidoreductase subunit alpha
VLAPSSVQESADFVKLGFDLAFKYRTPSMILTDGAIGQMMEKVEFFPQIPRRTDAEVLEQCPWATTGKTKDRERNIITSLALKSEVMENHNLQLQEKYAKIEANEVRYEEIMCDDADYILVAYGTSARICQKTMQLARDKGIKLGILRLITLWPFPKKAINDLSKRVKGFLAVELSAGQMVEDVQLAVNGAVPVFHFGRFGGMIHSPEEVLSAFEQHFIQK